MVTRVGFQDNFYEMYAREKRQIVAYGAGFEFRRSFDQFPRIDLICDQKAKEIGEYRGIPVVEPEQLKDIGEPIYLIICVRDQRVCEEIVEAVSKFDIEAKVFLLCNNLSFTDSYFKTSRSYVHNEKASSLKVNIVDTGDTWIFNKFAVRLEEALTNYNVEVTISPNTRSDVDINHHIPFACYKPYPKDTLMITHVHSEKIVAFLKKQLDTAGMGICMSKDTMNQLISYGIPRGKLCYINPAQDNVIRPHKYCIGITHRCYDDCDVRKRATSLLDILDGVDASFFRFFIMGDGWDKIVEQMRAKGFEVTYYPNFIYDTYNTLMQQIDYYLYMGFDEGSMGYLDALAAGAGTIVTPQGFHLDVDCPIDYPCSTVKQFRGAFLDLQNQRKAKIEAVEGWNWRNYAWKHLEIWNYLLARKSLKELYRNQLCYEDGIFSTLLEDNRV